MLEKGSTTLIRQTAAQQLADVQRQHPEELFNLLIRVVPYLRSKSWETRTVAAKAIGGIVENAPRFDPNGPVQTQPGDDGAPIESDSPDLPPADDQLQLETLDLPAILAHGQKLLGSAGREYDAAWATMDPASRLADQKKRLMARLGLGGDYMEEDLVNETDFTAGTGSMLKLDTSLGRISRQPSVAHPGVGSATPSSATPASAVGLDETGLSKRQLNQLKRKNKLFAKHPACKIRVVDLAIHRRPSVDHVEEPGQSEPTPIKAEPGSDALPTPAFVEDGSPIVAAYRGPAGPDPSPLRTESAGDRDEWPFERLCDLLMLDLFDATWEVRHGAAMGLRELVRAHGAGAGRESGRSRPVNDRLNQRWLADLACRVCCVFILDRFGDYVSDTVVAPIREAVGQTLGSLMVHLSASSVRRVYTILHRLVMQDDLGRTHRVWEVGHGGMIGLRYLVAVRNDLLMSDDHLIDGVLQAATRGLADVDDDVRAVSAATLIPIAAEVVTLRPAIVRDVVQVIWDCLADVKDDLSASTGSVMDLLARLCAFPPVLEAMTANAQADPGHGFATLVPRLYPFLRHTITTVRAAVLRALLAFLRLGRDDVTAWASGKALGLVFQNLLVERHDEVSRLSEQVWVALVGRIHQRGPHNLGLALTPYVTTLMALALHPIGIPRFPWPMDPSCFLRPSALEQVDGGPMVVTARLTSDQIGAFRPPLSIASGPPSAATEPSNKRRRKTEPKEEPAPSAHNVDAHMMQGEVELVGFEVMLRSRIGTARAMGTAMRSWDASTAESIVKPSIEAGLRSPFWTSQTFALMMVEEYACSTLSPWPDGSHLPARLPPIDTGDSPADLRQRLAMDVRTMLEEDRPPAYRELVPLARSVRAACHALRTQFHEAGGIPSSKIPSTAVIVQGDADAGPEAFSMVEAERIVGTEFDRLKQAMPPAQRIQCLPALMATREQAQQSLEQVQQAKARADVRVLAAAAAALVALDDVPSKPSRMIKGIMDSVKTEGTVELQHRSAAALAVLVKRYVDGGRRGPVDKIISNLVKFSCVDLSETPDFRRSQALTTVVLSLRKEEDRKAHVDAAKFEEEARQARIMRRGAKDALNLIARRFGGELLSKVPMLQGLMEDALRYVFADDRDVSVVTDPDRELGQQVIDGLSTIRTLVASLDVNLHPFVLGLLPLIVKVLHHPLSVIRYAAAKCLASICGVITMEGMTFLVEKVLPFVGHPVEVEYRQGGIECIYREFVTHRAPEFLVGALVLTGLGWGGFFFQIWFTSCRITSFHMWSF